MFYATLLLISIACYSQFKFLLTEYWFPGIWKLSKGPIIWGICLFLIHRGLARSRYRGGTTKSDLLFVPIVTLVLTIGLFIDPLLAPIVLIIAAWYLGSSTADVSQMLIVGSFLLFSLPFYSYAKISVLQPLTVIATENILAMVGIPILVQEFYIAIPGGQFLIEDGCSGERYMTNNIFLLFLFSLICKFTFRQFLVGVLVAVPIALLVNWVRVVTIILTAHNSGIDHSLVSDHENFGWLLYALFLIPFYFFLLRIDRYSPTKFTFSLLSASKRKIDMPAGILLLIPVSIVFWHQWLFKP